MKETQKIKLFQQKSLKRFVCQFWVSLTSRQQNMHFWNWLQKLQKNVMRFVDKNSHLTKKHAILTSSFWIILKAMIVATVLGLLFGVASICYFGWKVVPTIEMWLVVTCQRPSHVSISRKSDCYYLTKGLKYNWKIV